jgi:hypothetical protein
MDSTNSLISLLDGLWFLTRFRSYQITLSFAIPLLLGGHCGRDHMVVGFTTTFPISVYNHLRCEFEPHSWQCVLDTTLCDSLSVICDRSVGTPVSFTNKLCLVNLTWAWRLGFGFPFLKWSVEIYISPVRWYFYICSCLHSCSYLIELYW